MSEIWKDIYFWENGIEWDYTGLYQISNFGRVKSLIDNHGQKREKILKAVENGYGYERVNLHKNHQKKAFKIHRLVAHMFIEGYFEGAEVNHKDENKTNNHVSNLEWCTSKYNANYGTRNEKLSETNKGEKHPQARKVVMIDSSTMQIVFIWQYKKQAIDFYNISRSTLDYYLKGEAKSGHEYNGFLFYYFDEYESLKNNIN